MGQVNFFKGCLPQILLGPFLNTLTQLNFGISVGFINWACIRPHIRHQTNFRFQTSSLHVNPSKFRYVWRRLCSCVSFNIKKFVIASLMSGIFLIFWIWLKFSLNLELPAERLHSSKKDPLVNTNTHTHTPIPFVPNRTSQRLKAAYSENYFRN